MSVEDLVEEVREEAALAEGDMFAALRTYGADPDSMVSVLLDIVGPSAGTAALYAADFYRKVLPEARYSPTRDDDMAAEKLANIVQWSFAGPQSPESRLISATNRLVFDAARRTILVNAKAEGVAIARLEEAQCCSKCIARATTMPKAHNHSSDDVDQFFHPKCEGMFVPVRKGVWEPPSYAREWHDSITEARLAGHSEPDDIASWLKTH